MTKIIFQLLWFWGGFAYVCLKVMTGTLGLESVANVFRAILLRSKHIARIKLWVDNRPRIFAPFRAIFIV